MPRLAPLYLAASLCLGMGAFALALAAALKSGRRELRYFLGMLGILVLLVASNLVLFSLESPGAPAAGGIGPAMYPLIALNKCLSVLLCLAGSLLAQAILDAPWRRLGAILACGLSLASLPLTVLPPYMGYDAAGRQLVFSMAIDVSMLASLANIAYTLALLLLFRSRIPEDLTRRLALVFFILTALFAPAIVADIVASRNLRFLRELPTRPILFPLYLAALSVAIFALALPYLSRPDGGGAGEPPRGGLLLELAARHDVTAREGEIMGLVIAGLSNKQIAQKLGISDRTVGNHIYSLYHKLGINSRFELMGLLREKAS